MQWPEMEAILICWNLHGKTLEIFDIIGGVYSFGTSVCCNLGHLHCKHSISWNWNLHRWGLLLSYLAAGPCNFSHKPRWTKVSHSKFSRKRWTLAAPGIIINLEQKSLFSIIYGLHNFWRSLPDKIAFSNFLIMYDQSILEM